MKRKLTIKRLAKIAEHLETGKLGHKKFFFGQWNADYLLRPLDSNGCGFAGCAIGECPFIFPKQWGWKNGEPALRKGSRRFPQFDGQDFLELRDDEFRHLFLPLHQSVGRWGGKVLGPYATRKQVASNIRKFIKRIESAEAQP